MTHPQGFYLGARLLLMFCFGTAHCAISRPVWFPTLLACERAIPRFTAHARKVVAGRVVAECVVH